MRTIQRLALQNLQAFAGTQRFEVPHRAHVDIGCVVPSVGQVPGDRHAASEHLQPTFPVAKVREGHDGLAPHPQHLPQELVWVAGSLQGLRHDDVVKRIVVKI